MRTKVTLSLLAILLSAFGAVGALFSHLDASPFAQRRLSLPQKRSTGCQRDLSLLRRYTWVRHSHLSGSASGPWSASLRFSPKGKALYHKEGSIGGDKTLTTSAHPYKLQPGCVLSYKLDRFSYRQTLAATMTPYGPVFGIRAFRKLRAGVFFYQDDAFPVRRSVYMVFSPKDLFARSGKQPKHCQVTIVVTLTSPPQSKRKVSRTYTLKQACTLSYRSKVGRVTFPETSAEWLQRKPGTWAPMLQKHQRQKRQANPPPRSYKEVFEYRLYRVLQDAFGKHYEWSTKRPDVLHKAISKAHTLGNTFGAPYWLPKEKKATKAHKKTTTH